MTSGRKGEYLTSIDTQPSDDANNQPTRNLTAPPPAINWSTRPNGHQQNTGTLDGLEASSSPAGTQTVTVSVDRERLRQVEELLRHLGQPPLVNLGTLEENIKSREVESTKRSSVSNPLEGLRRHLGHHTRVPAGRNLSTSQEHVESREVKPSGCASDKNSFSDLRRSNPQDGRDEPSEFLKLTAAFSRLSTSNNPALFEARTPPGSSAVQLSPRKDIKYYAITISKCAGVYYGEWDDVRCLIDHVAGARYKSFRTLAQAAEFYQEVKGKGRVHIVRNPGDEERFGPESNAIQ